ncbi:uncharacterized protein [Aristolochia californica]|uniref:uncharacterized protein n=1 Tax=Aristolochia californica TaxID=171875 RepID=UPI0035DD510D
MVSERSTLGDSPSPEDIRQVLSDLQQRSTHQGAEITNIHNTLHTLESSLQTVIRQLAALQSPVPPLATNFQPLAAHHPHFMPPPPPLMRQQPVPLAAHAQGPTTVPRYVKLNFPTYDGSKDPLLWFTKCEQFFYHQHMVDVDKMRFGPPASSNPVGDLINYKQTGTLELYHKTFQERLARASEFVPPHLHVQIFNAGLTEKQRVMRESLGQKPFWNNRLPGTAPGPRFGSSAPNRADQSTSVPPHNLPRKFLTKQEMEARKAKGLCFNCDEKFLLGHTYKRLFSIELWQEGPKELPEIDIVEEEQQDPELSLHAMHGLRSSNTMQVKAKLPHLLLLALVDSGSTHNFISEPATKQLGLEIQQQKGLSISVANGAKIPSVGLCANTPFTIEGHSFRADLLVIPLAGFDLVLGVKWLQLLGPILWDFQAQNMTFTTQQGQITLQGIMA